MYPYLLRLGDIALPSYPLFYGLGIALAGVVILILARKEGLKPHRVVHLIPILAFAIVAGGRAFFVFQHLENFSGRWHEALDISAGGQVFYGGLILALPLLLLYCKTARTPVGRTLDLVAVGAPLGLAVGRIGCYCRGCCYGHLSDLPWAVSFPKVIDTNGNVVGSPVFLDHLNEGAISSIAEASLPVHPAQIYAGIASLIIFGVMILLWRSRRFENRLLLAYFPLYAVVRFLIEFTRDNEMAFWGLTIPQVVSAIVFASAASVLWLLH